jgi:hypothetical protein
MQDEEEYLEWQDPEANDEVVARMYAERVVFVQAKYYQDLLTQPGARRVPEGVAFPITNSDEVKQLVALAAKIKK